MIERIFPFLGWARLTSLHTLRHDAVAGLAVALVLIPQSLAYAQLAGVPAHHGLYASLIPVALGALFGSSRQLATGPVALTALLTAASVTPLAVAGTSKFVAYVVLLALLFVLAVTGVSWPDGEMDPITNENVSWTMFGDSSSSGYALVVLMIGLLLLVAILGGVFLAKEEKE